MGLIAAGCSSSSGDDTTTRTAPLDGQEDPLLDQIPYEHPLKGVELVEGMVPAVDIHDSPNGARYGLESGAWADENNESVTSSELVEYEVGPIDSEFDTATQLRKQNDYPQNIGTVEIPKIGRFLNDFSREYGKQLPVTVWVKMTPEERFAQKLERLIGIGVIQSESDYHEQFQALAANRASRISAALDDASDIFQAEGVTVTSRCKSFPCINILATRTQLESLEPYASFEHFSHTTQV